MKMTRSVGTLRSTRTKDLIKVSDKQVSCFFPTGTRWQGNVGGIRNKEPDLFGVGRLTALKIERFLAHNIRGYPAVIQRELDLPLVLPIKVLP
jgi:hypothetical protein